VQLYFTDTASYITEKQLMIQIAELVPKHHGRTKKQEPPSNASNVGPSKAKGGKKKK
jgi:signal recognition particle subunit SRP19